MFTGSHLTLFILNAILPLIWIPILIKNVVAYFRLKNDVTESEAHLKHLEDSIPFITDDTPDDLRENIKAVRARVQLSRDYNMAGLKFAFHSMIFWVILGCMMALCATLDTIKIGVKLYHKECPCEMAVEAAKKALTNSVPETVSVEVKND